MENKQNEMSPEWLTIRDWLENVSFKKRIIGGVDEAEVWKKIEELNALYERALIAERSRLLALRNENDDGQSAEGEDSAEGEGIAEGNDGNGDGEPDE